MNEIDAVIQRISGMNSQEARQFISSYADIVPVFYKISQQGPVHLLKLIIESLNPPQVDMVSKQSKLDEWKSRYLDEAMIDYIKESNLDCCEKCLKLGADEHAVNNEGKTAVELAQPRVADWFIQTGRRIKWQFVVELNKRVTKLEKEVSEGVNDKASIFKSKL